MGQERSETSAIVTTRANGLARPIHERTSLILSPASLDARVAPGEPRTGRTATPEAAAPRAEAPARLPQAVPSATAAAPLVSCIMPTRDRPDWAAQAVRYFLRQDYPERELVIVDASATAGLAGRLPADPRVRYHHMPGSPSIGAMRNRACELARGAVLVQWDDDDWHGPGRLGAQARPILAGEADITGLRGAAILELPDLAVWRCSPDLHRRLFVLDVHCGTLAFRRELFGRLARYPDRSLAEDAKFLRRATARGARLAAVPAEGLFVYLRHGANTWRFACGRHLGPAGWARCAEEPPGLAADRAFYVARAGGDGVRPASAAAAGTARLVARLMATVGRRSLVPRALAHFLP